MRRYYTPPKYVEIRFEYIDVLSTSVNDGFAADIQWQDNLSK